MGKTAVDRRATGIPGSDAAEKVAAMGGPVAQRASRPAESGPAPLTFTKWSSRSRPQIADSQGDDEWEDVALTEDDNDAASANAAIEDWMPSRTTLTGRRRRLAEQERQRMKEDAPVTAPKRSTRSSIPVRRKTDALPRQRGRLSGVAPLLLGALILIVLYVVTGWLYSLEVAVSNRWRYGPTSTYHLDAIVGDNDSSAHLTHFVAMNVHGTIVIQVAPGGDFSQTSTYVMPAQTFHGWGNLDDIAVTLTVSGGGPTPNILVHLEGDPDLTHFYQRPSATFVLLNQHPGFKVGLFMDQ